jgi:transposase
MRILTHLIFVLIVMQMIYLTILTKRNGNSIEAYAVFDKLLYKTRFVVERTNAWLNAFKAVLVRFETNTLHWKILLLLAFAVILLQKL